MGVLPDWLIERDVKIEPFSPAEKREGVISYGVTSYGYDVRLGFKFKVFKPYPAEVIDPKDFNPRMLEAVDLTQSAAHDIETYERQGEAREHSGYRCSRCGKVLLVGKDILDPPCPKGKPGYILIPPHSFVLGESLETFWIPRDMGSIVVGKSTYARCGLIVNVTPGEPEWGGKWTIELSNTTPLPMKVYCGEGIMQVMFLRSDGYRDLMVRVFKEWYAHAEQMIALAGNNTVARGWSLFRSVWDTFWGKVTCDKSYADKKGKYQNQAGLTLPTVDGKETR
jgi:dCTP deaminase